METKLKIWVCAVAMCLLIVCQSVTAEELANDAKDVPNMTVYESDEIEWQIVWQDEIGTAKVVYGEPEFLKGLILREALRRIKGFIIKPKPNPVGAILRRGTLQDGREVVLDVGDENSGWTHIVRRNHHNDLMKKFGLRDNDEAVKNFIMENLGKAPCERDENDPTKCKIRVSQRGKNKDLLIVVSQDRLRIITAHPARKK